jgi:putative membrane protein
MTVRGFIVGTVATAIAFFIVTELLPQFVAYEGEMIGLLGLAVLFGLVNGIIGPIIKLVALPITFMTMGLFGFVVNAVLLLLTAFVADLAGLSLTVGDFPPDLTADTVVAAIVGAVILGVVNSVVRMVVPD